MSETVRTPRRTPRRAAVRAAVRSAALRGAARRVGGGPVPMARSAAMMHAAIYDAESSYRLKWQGKITSEPSIKAENYVGRAEGPDEEERVIGRTAYSILLGLHGTKQSRYADQTQYLDARFRERFGSDNPPVYVGDNKPGARRPTSHPDLPDASRDEDSDAISPFYGRVKPFSLASGSQFRPTTLTRYGSYEAHRPVAPVSAVREGGLAPQRKPLLKSPTGVNISPCFLVYVSGHASFGGAWAGVMKRYFGSDDISFDLTTEEPRSPVKTRHFTSFSAAGKEDADSRIRLGVPYPWDATDGPALGDKIANQVFTTKLRTL
ncbi:hypothetical protein [Streptomyces sp. NBC_01244]|uniref:hypothetical protein n=1 Tax=Streptomyces sp. NBC_01244 TaxID=2903797 RepID=UPI002E0FB322|nr:hypothetical protein OG247_23825 [Streptomyces sp. NBC_01244]